MPSLWIEGRDKHGRRRDMRMMRGLSIEGAVKAMHATLKQTPFLERTVLSPMEALVTMPSGDRRYLAIEQFSPPSAPEPNQPVIRNGKVMMLRGAKLIEVCDAKAPVRSKGA